uniref:CSON015541 protein n=1 Tax=Culicoides sonorensis TaxID=179676 RepID=A0A336KT86_CULSO
MKKTRIMKTFYKILILHVMAQFCASQEVFNMTEYFKMPPLVNGDNFDKCLEGSHDLRVFCAVTTFIKPDKSNFVWNIIEKYSNDTKRNYRHDIVRSGLCISRCEEELKNLDESYLESLKGDYFDVNYQYSLKNGTFKDVELYRNEYGTLVDQCLNNYLRNEYNLSSFSQIIYCTTNQEEHDIDGLDITFLIILLSIVVLVIGSTYYDKLLNRKGDTSHYKDSIESLCK